MVEHNSIYESVCVQHTVFAISDEKRAIFLHIEYVCVFVYINKIE